MIRKAERETVVYQCPEENARNMVVRCHNCRHVLLEDLECVLLTAHGTTVVNSTDSMDLCHSLKENYVWYLQEDKLPEWITMSVTQVGWTKGKLLCPNCQIRIGSFDFVSGLKCACSQFVVPPVHIVQRKVDYVKMSIT